MDEKSKGANTEETSPNSSSEMGDSQSQESSKGDESNQSLSDYLTSNVDAAKSKDDSDESPVVEGEEENSEVQKLNETEQDNTSSEEKKEGEKEGEKKEDSPEGESEDEEEEDKGKDRTAEGRIKELVEQKNEATTQFEAVKPKVESYDKINTFCQSNGITPDQFSKALEIQALLNTNPVEALKAILPIVESLQGFVGNKLPEDLQGKVDSGKLEIDDAKEIAKLRAEKEFGSKKSVFEQQRMQASQQQFLQQQMADSFQTWDTTKRASDPDYKPKAKESEPDGKWENVRDKYLAMLNETRVNGNQVVYVNPVRTPQEMVNLVEKAYSAVNASQAKRNGNRPATRKQLSSSGSSTTKTNGKKTFEQAGSLKELADIVLPNRR